MGKASVFGRAAAKRGAVVCALAVVVAMVAGCGAKGSSSGGDDSSGTTTTAAASGALMFGDAPSPCGPGNATVKKDEAGKGTDKLYIGAASDKGSTIRAGLLGEMYDAGAAFAQWCNAQGGIAGMKIQVVDLDGKLFQVSQSMVTACKDTFAMVGGGHALDGGEFTGKAESDFHMCHMIDIPGFANQPEKADSNGYVAPVPNVTNPRAMTFWQQFALDHPTDIDKTVVVYSDAVAYNRDQLSESIKVLPKWKIVDEINYPAVGNVDFKLVSQRIKQSGAKVVNLVGEPQAAVQLVKAMDEDGIHPWVILETNFYTDDLKAVSDISSKVIVRTVSHPFEEASQWPGTNDYVKMMEAYRKAGHPEAKIASLGVQSTSAWLLFATAASKCGTTGDHVISRECVMKNAMAVHSWTGHGLHATTDPGKRQPTKCVMAVTLKNGGWVRLWPTIGGKDDGGEGFLCRNDGIIDVPALAKKYAGKGKVDPSRNP